MLVKQGLTRVTTSRTILDAYDLRGSYHAAAGLAGCDQHRVARYDRMREQGTNPEQRRYRARPIEEYLPKDRGAGGRITGAHPGVVHQRI